MKGLNEGSQDSGPSNQWYDELNEGSHDHQRDGMKELSKGVMTIEGMV